MFSKILIKLIDQAIFPALLILLTRFISLVVVAAILNIDFFIENTGFVFNNQSDFNVVNAYSMLSVVIVFSICMLYVMVKSFIFHDSHISPKLTAQLLNWNLTSLVQNSFDLYSQGAIWLAYGYLLMLVCGIMSFFGILYTWVFIIMILNTILATVLLFLDIENEWAFHTIIAEDILKQDDEVVVLNMEK